MSKQQPQPESATKVKKLANTQFTTKPCAICEKPVQVLTTHKGDTWCLEHAGTWKKPAKKKGGK